MNRGESFRRIIESGKYILHVELSVPVQIERIIKSVGMRELQPGSCNSFTNYMLFFDSKFERLSCESASVK